LTTNQTIMRAAFDAILLWACLTAAEGGRGSRAKARCCCFVHRQSELRSRSCPEIRWLTQRQQGRRRDIAIVPDSATCLDGVEDSIKAATIRYGLRQNDKSTILLHDQTDRETIGVVTNLSRRLAGLARNNDCRRCWLQRKHCICDRCPPLGHIPSVRRLFLLTHHKEIGLIVDTAKLIMSSFPTTVRLVVSGIKHEFQPTLVEMTEVLEQSTSGNGRCLVLFPTDDALTFEEIVDDMQSSESPCKLDDEPWSVVVIDGTWSQARKMFSKYLANYSGGNLYRVQLSSNAVAGLDQNESSIDSGHQLRRHPIKWREISTLEATRLLLKDMHPGGEFDREADMMAQYQEIGNAAARRQLGPPREK